MEEIIGRGLTAKAREALGKPNADGGSIFVNPDQWDGYQPARNRVYDVIKGTTTGQPVDNVVVLTGDIHSSWAADLTQDPNNADTATGGYNPAILADGIEFANPEWAKDRNLVTAEAAEIDIRLWPLLRGHVVLPLITLTGVVADVTTR